MFSSDVAAADLSTGPIDALRYDGQSDEPDEVAGILHRLMPAGVSVLDVGCGTGSVALIANRGKDNDVLGIEPDPDRCALATARGLKVMNGFLNEETAAGLGPFAVVMSSDVLEHMVDPGAALRQFRDVLADDGVILVSVPNVAHWSVRVNLLFGRFHYAEYGIMDATHLRWFTRRTICQLVESNGFVVEEVATTAGYTLPVYTLGALRRLPRGLVRAIVRSGNRWLPTLFGGQVVVAARKARASGAAHR